MSLYALKFKNEEGYYLHVAESFFKDPKDYELLKCNVATNVTLFPLIEKAEFYHNLAKEKGLELELVKVRYKLEVIND